MLSLLLKKSYCNQIDSDYGISEALWKIHSRSGHRSPRHPGRALTAVNSDDVLPATELILGSFAFPIRPISCTLRYAHPVRSTRARQAPPDIRLCEAVSLCAWRNPLEVHGCTNRRVDIYRSLGREDLSAIWSISRIEFPQHLSAGSST